MSNAYVVFLAVVVLAVSGAGVAVGLFWGLPDAFRTYHYWRKEGDEPRSVYSFWRLVRSCLAFSCLGAFVVIALTILFIPDGNDPTRVLVVRHLNVYIVIAISSLVISEPVAERRIDGALEDSDKERDTKRDLERDPARDAGRDLGRDAPRDTARDQAHDESMRDV